MNQMTKVFALNLKGINIPRGLEVVGVLLVPLIVLGVLDKDKFLLSATFAILFVALSDPGGIYDVRLREMAWVGIVGGLLTALGFAVGGGPWGWVVLAAFAVTLVSGIALKFGVHRFTSGLMLNAWFLIAISVPAGEHLNPSRSDWWGQAIAWLGGAAFWIAFTFVAWIARGRQAQASHIPEIPGDMNVTKLAKPVVMFMIIRALAVAIAIAIAIGLTLPNADWMPVATLVAMKASLDQTALMAEQRLIGAFLGALVATVFLFLVGNMHALDAVIILLGAAAASIRAVNYAIYCAAIAGMVLIGMDLSHPTNHTAEFDRVLFTLAGVGVAWLVMLGANLLQKRSTKSTASTAPAGPEGASADADRWRMGSRRWPAPVNGADLSCGPCSPHSDRLALSCCSSSSCPWTDPYVQWRSPSWCRGREARRAAIVPMRTSCGSKSGGPPGLGPCQPVGQYTFCR